MPVEKRFAQLGLFGTGLISCIFNFVIYKHLPITLFLRRTDCQPIRRQANGAAIVGIPSVAGPVENLVVFQLFLIN